MLYGNYMGGDVRHIYGSHADKPTSHEVSRWGSKETQHANFEQVADILDAYPKVKTLLDVGSGLGDIRPFLNDEIRYTGIDITPEVVRRANDPDIFEGDIVEHDFNDETYDAVVALGSFNMGVPHEQVLQALNKMVELANEVAIVTISYIHPNELDELPEGWKVITNPQAFSGGYGDNYVLIYEK